MRIVRTYLSVSRTNELAGWSQEKLHQFVIINETAIAVKCT